jgi:hypothetical protein
MYLTGWSPDKNQPRAAKRGSGTVSFEELASYLENAQPDDSGRVPPPPGPHSSSGGGASSSGGGAGGGAGSAA